MAVTTTHPFAAFEDATWRLVSEMQRRARPGSDLFGIAERVVEREEELLLQLAADAWEQRAAVERELAEDFEMTYRALDTMLGFSHGLGLILSDRLPSTEADPPAAVRYATSLLHVGAVGAGHEAMAMLRAGLTAGAEARWRTIHEFAVVASALRVGNRGTASRFVHHRWVQIDHQLRWTTDVEWQDLRREAARRVERLTRRYGRAFATPYGWAAELSLRKLGVKTPGFHDLEKLPGLRYHSSRRMMAHHLVHADALAMTSRTLEGVFHSGGNVSRLRDVCARTIFTLHDLNAALLDLWLRHHKSGRRLGALRALNAELGAVLHRDCTVDYASIDHEREGP